MGAVRKGAAGAVVAMGNTGACVGASTIGLGTLEGVRRPGIAVSLDLFGSPITILDMGANVAPKPEPAPFIEHHTADLAGFLARLT